LYTSGRLARLSARRTIPMPDFERTAMIDLFRRAGALLEGHFRLSSGLHSSGYLQCALVLQDPRTAGELGAALGARLAELRPSVVLSPALGGILVGHEVARALGVRGIFAERQDGRLMLRRGFSLAPGERVVVVEDVVTTGLSTRETLEVARAAGGEVVGAGALVDRGGGRSNLGVPFVALLELDLPAWREDACPLCAEGRPVVKPGSRPAA
jgi:orotate phosphoribosyltransferase